MDPKKKREIFAFFWFIVAVLTLLSLLSYTPNDIPFETSTPNIPTQNFAGIAGAYIAWFFLLFFGKTSYFLVVIFLCWGISKWIGRAGQKLWLKIFSMSVFFASSCAIFALLNEASYAMRFTHGGFVGFYTSVLLNNVFGKAGLFVASGLFLLSIFLTTEMLLLEAAGSLLTKFKGTLSQVAGATTNSDKGERANKDIFSLKKATPEKTSVVKEALQKISQKAALTSAKTLEKAKVSGDAAESDLKKSAPSKILPAAPIADENAKQQNKPQIKLSVPKPEIPKTPPSSEPSITKSAVMDASDANIPDNYKLPSLDLLHRPTLKDQDKLKEDLEANSKLLEDTLRDFGIEAKVVEVEQGPTITRYELEPAAGVKVQKITSLENDIALAMRATSVRIIAPIPGKSRVGIEVPNMAAQTVYMREVLESAEFQNEKSPVAMIIGKDTAGSPIVCNLADMPHLLIAGATNTGKSVCINTIISSLLYRSTPDQLKFIMIDPKMVELHFYNDLPHLIAPVVVDKTKAPGALAWLLSEMERRYKILSKVGAKNIVSYNDKVSNKQIDPSSLKHNEDNKEEAVVIKKMPYIVLIIDELADLMMSSAQEVESSITRLAQLARAVGIHMILATQRPSVDVITGVIKANIPARIAFQVASKVDSRTILDENGADKLLGRGDLLLMDPRRSKLIRAQGAWVQDSEIEKITQFIKNQKKATFTENILQSSTTERKSAGTDFKKDEMYEDAKRVVIDTGQASVSMVQRRLGLGYTRAARLIDMMEEEGIVGPYRGAKPREILVERPSKTPGGDEQIDS